MGRRSRKRRLRGSRTNERETIGRKRRGSGGKGGEKEKNRSK